MFQLNNKKGSAFSKMVIVILIVLVISVTITIFCIYSKNSKKEDNNLNASQENNANINSLNEDNLRINSTFDKFDNNSIKIIDKDYTKGEEIKENEWVSYHKVEIYYPQIDGLINESVQNKINNDIKDKITAINNKDYFNDKTIKRISISTSVKGNFANVISIKAEGFIDYIDNNKERSIIEPIYLNYRLDNGESFKFEDLFIAGAPINSIISNSLYKDLAWSEQENFGTIDMSKIDYSRYEDEMLKVIRLYKNDKSPKFYFTPQNIYLKIAGYNKLITIDMLENYNDIAIYKRYLNTSNLYKDNNVGLKNSFVFTNRYEGLYNFYGENGDNLFVMLTLNSTKVNTDKINNILPNIKKELDKKVDNIKSSIQNNKGIIYLINGFVEYNNEKNQIELSLSEQVLTMDLSLYKQNGYSKIVDYERRQKVSADEDFLKYNDKDKNNIKNESKNITLIFDINGNLVK